MKADAQLATPDLATARELALRFGADSRHRFGDRMGRVRLFGSAARGDWTPESDVDILVTLDTVSVFDVDWIAARALRMGVMEAGVVLQPVVMDESRFRHLLSRERGFALDVEREGIPL